MRRPSSRSSSYPCQHRLATGRDRTRHRPAARAPQCGNHAQIHPCRRRHGAGRRRDRRRHSGALSHGGQETHAPHRRRHRPPASARAGIYRLGQPRPRSRGPGTANRSADLYHVARCPRRIKARLSRSRLNDGDRRGPQEMPRAAGRPRAPTERPRRNALFRCCRNLSRASGKEAHFDRYKPSTRMGVHYLLSSRILPEFGSKKLDRMTGAQLSRWFDAFSRTAPGQRQSCPGAAPADHELRGRLRLHREEPDPGYQAQPPAQAYPLPVA